MNEKITVSDKEILVAIKDLLKKNGHLDKITAEVRSQVTEILQGRRTDSGNQNTSPPTPTDEVMLVNELVREYLEWNGYLYTSSVMMSEAGMSREKKGRAELCAEVGVRDDDKSSALPLLANIVAAYTERIRRKISKSRKEPR